MPHNSKPEQISLPTTAGDALAVRLASTLWRLTTPWNEEIYTGDRSGAFKRLRAQVWEAEADPAHNSVHQAVQSAILFITSPVAPRRAAHGNSLAEASHEATWVIDRSVPV